ncbi:MAG: HI0074 family nucleotidyltransferase substrate-binding subunit [Candidatus Babeliaceae bacterium]
MDRLKSHYEQLLKAYSRLKYMTQKFVELKKEQKTKSVSTEEENEFIVHRDALIQRFEFCYDLTWKFLKQLLKENYALDIASPRKVFQECFQQKLLTAQESMNLIEMIDARNQTSHIYNESTIDAISEKIINYYQFLAEIATKIKP